jgi:hypothetical protein
MPAHIRPEPSAAAIVFERDGEDPETWLVHGDGERLLLYAVTVLIQRRRLHVGDRVTIRAQTDDDGDIP